MLSDIRAIYYQKIKLCKGPPMHVDKFFMNSTVFLLSIACLSFPQCGLIGSIRRPASIAPRIHPKIKISLEEAGVVTDCEIRTLESTGVLSFDLSRDNIINVVIFRTEILKEVWAELDTSSDVLEILISPDEPYFRLTTFGNAGTVQVDYSKDSEMVESFQCKRHQKNSYKLPLIKQCAKALNLSSKVAMRTDQLGLICLQFLVRTEDGTATFVEYYCTPNLDE